MTQQISNVNIIQLIVWCVISSVHTCRVTLRYGGRDITTTFSWLLDHIAFPYIKCQPDANVLDALLLQELKHSYCHMDTVGVILLYICM